MTMQEPSLKLDVYLNVLYSLDQPASINSRFSSVDVITREA